MIVVTEADAPGVVDPTEHETVVVIDFGAQYAQLIARRVREANVFSTILPHRVTAEELAALKPAGIILSGGPKSVHVEGAPTIDPDIYETGIPILGICYGAQLLAQNLGGTVVPLAAACGELMAAVDAEVVDAGGDCDGCFSTAASTPQCTFFLGRAAQR